MRLRAPCIWLRLGIAILSLEGASGWAFAVELQKFDPARCENNDHQNDKDCVRNWYAEYSAGVISEFKYYAGLEDFLAEMLADPQETLLTAKLSLILIEGGTKYSQWAVLADRGAAESAELDMPRYDAIVGVCRDAIAEMRSALFDLRQHRDKARLEARQYLKNAMACEKAFLLTFPTSKLRGHGASERPPASPASGGPLQITPNR